MWRGINGGGSRFTDVVVALFAAVATCVLIEWVLGHSVLVSNPDAVDIFLPQAFDSSRAAASDGITAMLFNSHLLAGYSQWLNANYSPLYPFFFNWLGSDQTTFDTLLRLEFVVRLHMVILALGSYWLSRELGAGRWAAFCLSLALPWMPGVQTTFGWPHIIASLAWIPYVLAAQVRLARAERVSLAGVLSLAVPAALLVYAQPAQNLVVAALASAVMWVLPVRMILRNRDAQVVVRKPAVTATSLVAASLLTLIVCGYYLVRLIDFQGESIRWLGSFGHLIGHKRVPIEALREFAVSPRSMLSVISFKPEYSGHPGNLYVGSPVLALALYAVFRTRNTFVRSLGITAALAFVLCCSWVVPISYWIPLINKIRELSWWSCLWVLLVLPLAAVGASLVVSPVDQGGATRRDVMWLVCGIAIATIVVVLVDESITQAPSMVTLALVCAVLSFLKIRTIGGGVYKFLPALLGLSAFVPAAYLMPHSTQEGSYFFSPRNIAMRAQARELASGVSSEDKLLYRAAVDFNAPDFKVLTHMLANQGMRMIRGDIHPQLFDKFNLLYFPKPSVQRLYGIRLNAVVGGEHGMHWETVDGARPRLYFRPVKPTRVAKPVDAILADPAHDLARDFIDEKTAPLPSLDGLPDSYAGTLPVSIRDNRDTAIKAILETRSAGLLVLNEDPEGSWSAYINNVAAEPIRLNAFQTAFVVPAGGIYEIQIKGGR